VCVLFFSFFFCFNKLVNVNLIGYEHFFLCNIECIKNYKDNINSIVKSFLVICPKTVILDKNYPND
jgi:hypothetical protein